MKITRTKLKWIAGGSIALTLAWLALSLVVALKYTGRGRPPFDEPAPEIAWGHIEPLRLHTQDGEELGAWFIDGRPEKPTILFLHGNSSCRSNCLPIGQALAANGDSVLLVTMRAHGDSTGSLNDFGYGARYDVMAAIGWLESNHPGRRIVVWGQSLGSAAALFAAGEIGMHVSGYVLECPYKDIYSTVWNRLQMRLPLVLDRVAYWGLLAVSPVVLPQASGLSPLEASANIPKSVPVLILAGSNDGRAPPDDARKIAGRIGEHARLVIFDGADHLGLQAADPGRYQAMIGEFISGCQASGP
jgi:fermentation-respiration switch protein FrsA (DUF1100 family)